MDSSNSLIKKHLKLLHQEFLAYIKRQNNNQGESIGKNNQIGYNNNNINGKNEINPNSNE